MAVSFAMYGVIKKRTPLPPQVSLTAETLTAAPFALGYLGYVAVTHGQLASTPWQFVLLVLCGPMTAAPLLLFGAAAHRLPVVTMGLLQYLTPILQLLWAVALRHERLSPTTWTGLPWYGSRWSCSPRMRCGSSVHATEREHCESPEHRFKGLPFDDAPAEDVFIAFGLTAADRVVPRAGTLTRRSDQMRSK